MDGIIVVDKPKGLTSFDVIRRIRSLSRERRVGHSGTLDPLCTGILIVFLGNATKLSKYFLDGDKGYIGEMCLGCETDTYDGDGKIVKISKITPPKIEEILEVFKKFEGPLKQAPPMFSAIHHKGRRLYELARLGVLVEREKRKIVIKKLEMLEFNFPYIKFYVLCSKGTYVRSLVHDIGKMLGTSAFQSSLKRIYSHPFTIEDAIPLEGINYENLPSIILNPMLYLS